MIAKIVTGKSFGGAVRYLLEKSGHARMIDSDGVELFNIRSLIDSFKVGSINSIFYFLHKTAEPFNCLEQDNLA